jgi:hypothetical protein
MRFAEQVQTGPTGRPRELVPLGFADHAQVAFSDQQLAHGAQPPTVPQGIGIAATGVDKPFSAGVHGQIISIATGNTIRDEGLKILDSVISMESWI